MRIYCPKCGWRPLPESRWYCNCPTRHCWNTFTTGGKCPACSKQWEITACHDCHRFSPHKDWYHGDPDPPVVKKVRKRRHVKA